MEQAKYPSATIRYNENLFSIEYFKTYLNEAERGNPYNTTFSIRVVSGAFCGYASCEYDIKEFSRFVNEMEFDRLGVFTYSAEEGTAAYDFEPKVDEDVAKSRRDELYELQQAIAYEAAEQMTGRKLRVIVDGYLPDDDVYVARSYKDAPDIDGLVFVYSDRELVTGDMVTVEIKDAREYDLEGVLTDESAQ